MRYVRSIRAGVLLVVLTSFTGVAIANGASHFTYQRDTDNTLSWRASNQRLLLQSSSALQGIMVSKLEPADLWGLRRGDVITAVDHQAVRHVVDFTAQLSAHRPATVTLDVLRAGVKKVLSVTVGSYVEILPAAHPPPPPPHSPPSPPSPPTPTVSGSASGTPSHFRYLRETDHALSWRVRGHRILLHSGAASTGITVSKLNPVTLWGLRQGDVITAVDGHVIDSVGDLVRQLQRRRPAPVVLQSRRANTTVSLSLAASDYANLLPGEK